MADERVECERHGASHATFVCSHLMAASGSGFHAAVDEGQPGDPRPDAWCDACETRRLETGGEWTDESEPEVKLACAGCYDEIRRRESGPALDRDGWALRNALDHGESVPPLEEREGLVAGEAAKMVFELPGAVEAMWAVVVAAEPTGFTGWLDSEPRSETRLRRGQRFEFGPEHVVGILRDIPEDYLRELGVR